MCCGVVLILFGWFLSVSFLHALVFIRKTFCDLLKYVTLQKPLYLLNRISLPKKDSETCKQSSRNFLVYSLKRMMFSGCERCGREPILEVGHFERGISATSKIRTPVQHHRPLFVVHQQNVFISR